MNSDRLQMIQPKTLMNLKRIDHSMGQPDAIAGFEDTVGATIGWSFWYVSVLLS
jgi:hypothetical protein